MYPHKLKTHIVTTLFTLLVLAMVFINIVIFIFWYQHLVQEKMIHVKETVSLWYNQVHIDDFEKSSSENRNSLLMLHQQLGRDCRQILMVTNKSTVMAFDLPGDRALEQLVRSPFPLVKETIRYLNKSDVPFIFRPRRLVFILPLDLQVQGSKLGVVVDTKPMYMQLMKKEKIIFIYIFLNAFVLTVVGFFRMRYVLLNPIEKLANVAESYQISEGQGLFGEYTESEFGQLSKAMNAMIQRIEEDRRKLFSTVTSLEDSNKQLQDAQQEIIQSEKLAAAGRLSAGLAHEIGNPVAIIQGYLELLQNDKVSDDERSQFTGRSLEELQRIDRLLRQLMEITRSKESKKEVVYPVTVLRNLFEVLKTPFKKHYISVSHSLSDEPVSIFGDGELLRQVLLNLLLNAQDTIMERMQQSPGGNIHVKLNILDSDDENMVCIEVRDNGMGIQAKNLKFVFEPFFTTKAPGKGTGLGLAVSYRMIDSLGGRIEVTSEYGEGSVFRIFLPLYS